MEKITLKELKEQISTQGTLVIDVRENHEREEKKIAHTKHIPLKELPQHLEEFKGYKKIITHCAHGFRAKKAAEYLSHHLDCSIAYVLGDIEDWEAAGLPCS